MNRLVKEPDGTVRLYVGAENWPMPIPLVNWKDTWYFDTSAGKEEILFRRIGRNEIATIAVLRELVAAQKEYYAKTHDDGVKQYAQKFVSDEGKHNGLYWNASNRENESPIGPLVAYASSEGYAKKLRPVSRLLLPRPDGARQPRVRRCEELCRERPNDSRLCILGLSRRIRKLGHNVVYCRSRWSSLSERSRPEDGRVGQRSA